MVDSKLKIKSNQITDDPGGGGLQPNVGGYRATQGALQRHEGAMMALQRYGAQEF
jgi:hypothetical protein